MPPLPRIRRPPPRRPVGRLPATTGRVPTGLAPGTATQPRGGAQPTLASDPLFQRAMQETQVRYGPEHFALSQLMQQSLMDLLNRVQIARAANAGQQRTADVVRPAMQQAYDQGQQAVHDAYHGLKGGGIDKGYKGAIKHEEAAAQARVGEGMAGALAEVDARKLDASAGEAGATNQAVQDYMGTTSQVAQRQEALAQEEGAFTTATYGDAVAAHQAAVEKANQQAIANRHNRVMEQIGFKGLDVRLAGIQEQAAGRRATLGETSRHNRATEAIGARNAATKAAGGAGGGPMTPTQHRAAQAAINHAWSALHQAPGVASRRLIYDMMQSGLTTKKLAGTAQTLHAPSIPDPLYVHAASELVTTGRLGSGTYHALLGQGFRPPAAWMPRRPAPARPLRGRAGGFVAAGTVRR